MQFDTLADVHNMQCIYSHRQLLSFIFWQHHLFLLLLLLLLLILHLTKGQAYFSSFSSLSPSPISPSHFFPILLLLLLLLLFERGSFFSFSLFSWLLQVIVHLLKGQACRGCTRCHKRAQTGFNQSKLFAQELKPIHLQLLWVFDKFKEHVCTVEYLFSNRKFEVKIWQW